MDTVLKAFVNRLKSLPDRPPLDILKKCVMEVNRSQLPVDEYIHYSDQEYKRNVIYVSGKCEITALCFKKGQITPIHDHGESIGMTIIKAGTMTEELFNKQPTGMIVPTFTRRFRAGEMSYVNLTTIHRVSNVHNSGLVTINIYFPPLTLMNLYNSENTKVEKWAAQYSGVNKSV